MGGGGDEGGGGGLGGVGWGGGGATDLHGSFIAQARRNTVTGKFGSTAQPAGLRINIT